ncbi:MAG: type I-E CRISPR-associated protein Cse1/CasA [Ruminobacter sp.]|uniref:type I-E CRISPR-associated protein Cse1/CasA n=1 Tax=Ruminobacter sp. TaxID=2774296 RepID=UPI001B3E1A00|nr:type I-E CRISPR-associated protein Cse1/CasA [Ruminobacter sp.]MBP3748715.1 type I-E CRISPR-associated protein Cse1/CasA [Ruminobacter sp.]
MGRFNLLDEPWISVLAESGEKKEVSMLDIFKNAGDFLQIAGEMETQNFAVMRFLLSVVQTVFSRFDYNGEELPGVVLDDNGQTENVDEDDRDEYCSSTAECWENLYSGDKFPVVVCNYLEKWRDRFYLFDEVHPFFQVTKNEMNKIMSEIPGKDSPSPIYGKNINRTISESENKTALFSPIANIAIGKRSVKDVMSPAELARWLIMFQGYSGLADKVALTDKTQRSSKGWLFDLGGIFLQGRNVYETLVMNYMPESPTDNQAFIGRCQNPCWELTGIEVVENLCHKNFIDNLAELYTNWSRAIYIDPDTDMSAPVEIQVVKLPEIEHTENSIEPMTMWKWNDKDPNKNHFTPKKHNPEQSLWRNFGCIVLKSTNGDKKQPQRQPGILAQRMRIANSQRNSGLTDLVGVGMKDDGNATSWLPVNEVADSFRINNLLIENGNSDNSNDDWIIRINNAVETTKEIVSEKFRSFLRGISEIRNTPADSFTSAETEKMYSIIDSAFKKWLVSINPADSKEEKIKEWYAKLRTMVLRRGEELFDNSTARDLTGIEKDGKLVNIATRYWQFVGSINKKLNKD